MEGPNPPNETELTSTMGNLVTTNSEEKNDTSDSTPTSSTDAGSATHIQPPALDDPISSTSSEVPVLKQIPEATMAAKAESPKGSSVVSEKDMLDINITDTSAVKITENVDDIVQDLENLLGEPSIDYTAMSTKTIENRNSLANIDEYSKELESLNDVSKEVYPAAEEDREASEEQSKSEDIEEAGGEVITSEANVEIVEPTKEICGDAEPNTEVEKPQEDTVVVDTEMTEKNDDIPEDKAVEDIAEEKSAEFSEVAEMKVSNKDETAESEAVESTEDVTTMEVDQEPEEKLEQAGTPAEVAPEQTTESPESPEEPQLPVEEPVQESEDESAVEESEEAPKDNVAAEVGEPVVPEPENPIIGESVVQESEATEEQPEETPMDSVVEESKKAPEESVIEEPEHTPKEYVAEESEEYFVQEPVKAPEEPVIEEPEHTPEEYVDEESVKAPEQTSKEYVVAESEESHTQEPEDSVIEPEEAESRTQEPVDAPEDSTIEPEGAESLTQESVETPEESSKECVVDEPEESVVQESAEAVEISVQEPKEPEKVMIVEESAQEPEAVVEQPIEQELEKSSYEPMEVDEPAPPQEPQIDTPPPETNSPMEAEILTPEESPESAEPEEMQEADQALEAIPEESEVPEEETPPDTNDTEIVEEIKPVDEPQEMQSLQEEIMEPAVDLLSELISAAQTASQTPAISEPIMTYVEEMSAPQPEEAPPAQELPIVATETAPHQYKNLQTLLDAASLQPDTTAEPEAAPAKEHHKKSSKSSGKDTETAQSNLKEPLLINIDDSEKEKPYSPKITIKPIRPSDDEVVTCESEEKEGLKGSLKMTITKQDNTMHSILKIYDPEQDHQQEIVPKLIIKPVCSDQSQSPKISSRSSKVFSPSGRDSQRSSSPRITIKPIIKPPEESVVSPLKITIKPVMKPEESHRQRHSPKLTIKPLVKPDDEVETKVHSPRVTIKPIVKPPDEQETQSPRITIKPIAKPEEPTTPRVTIKPVLKPQERLEEQERFSPKITIKPIIKPQELDQGEDVEEPTKERIVLKINKGNLPSSSNTILGSPTSSNREEKSEKLAKIKLKFSKEGGHAHIVQEDSTCSSSSKRSAEDLDRPSKRFKTDDPLGSPSHSRLKDILSFHKAEVIMNLDDEDDDDVKIVDLSGKDSPIVISEESNQDPLSITDYGKPGGYMSSPAFELPTQAIQIISQPIVEAVVVAPPAPRKRGRPRKVPLEVREEFKEFKEDPKPECEQEPENRPNVMDRPKRSCRGQSVRATLGIKPRKPRGGGRGRGSKRGMGTRGAPEIVHIRDETPPRTPPSRQAKEPRLSAAKLRQQMKEELARALEFDEGASKSPGVSSGLAPPHVDLSDRADIVMFEEETRMSAEASSRAHTPAKQVVTSTPITVDIIDESQSSVQSSATTESVKVRKGPRFEVHQEPEGAVISADQLAEYYWSGGGPYMLQEQVAQFLGIKSFKRKYPNIPRRVVDMQERDFIRESGLAGEAMCDLGLTAVNSADILDIMYSDFQEKYEEYCKHQRDRQAKDLTNKQKALSLAASQEKTKMDITQQAVQSAASWNATFNKTRRDQRKACVDLQTLTIHFPKGKMKQINRGKLGNYPVALVPGQFTDFYQEFTPTEINNLPFNTLCYDTLIRNTQEMECDSQTDGSGSDSESSSSDSDSSFSGSSDGENCTLCNKTPLKRVAAQ